MIVVRLLRRASLALLRTLLIGALATKLLSIVGLETGAGLLGSIAGPGATQLAAALLALAFVVAIYSIVLRG